MLSAQPKFLNFNAINGSSATNKKLRAKDKPHNTYGFKIIPAKPLPYSFDKNVWSIEKINGKEQINMAFAGVGSPIKESD